MQPIVIDFENIRKERQRFNNNSIYDIIKSENITRLRDECNNKELDRILEEFQISIETLINECKKSDILTRMTAGRIAKLASRQGSNDEKIQIQTCNKISSQYKIHINQLPNDYLRPCKDGSIIDKKQYKQLADKNSCLKSFDAEIEGIWEGYVFAKVLFGNGGHQDNVIEEAHTFADWVLKFGKSDLLYVILIDTDQTSNSKFQQLKAKATKNLLVVNHIEFQQYIIDYHKVDI
jgi:hypothetical protein